MAEPPPPSPSANSTKRPGATSPPPPAAATAAAPSASLWRRVRTCGSTGPPNSTEEGKAKAAPVLVLVLVLVLVAARMPGCARRRDLFTMTPREPQLPCSSTRTTALWKTELSGCC
jgi:hypothetical protein